MPVMPSTAYDDDAARYLDALECAAEQWRLTHPAAFRELNEFCMRTYLAEPGGFAQRVRTVTRLAAEYAGFPPFHAWLAGTTAHGAAA